MSNVLVVKDETVHSSVAVVLLGVIPPATNAAAVLPLPLNCCLAVAKLAISVQLVPSQLSVSLAKGGLNPPTAKADVLLDPKPAKAYLAVFKSATSDQAEPFQDSVIAVVGLLPPKAKADVVVPAPP